MFKQAQTWRHESWWFLPGVSLEVMPRVRHEQGKKKVQSMHAVVYKTNIYKFFI